MQLTIHEKERKEGENAVDRDAYYAKNVIKSLALPFFPRKLDGFLADRHKRATTTICLE